MQESKRFRKLGGRRVSEHDIRKIESRKREEQKTREIR